MQLRMGALSPPLSVQLAGRGIVIGQDDMAHFEQDRQAILRLYIRGIISDEASNQAFNRLLRRIEGYSARDRREHG